MQKLAVHNWAFLAIILGFVVVGIAEQQTIQKSSKSLIDLNEDNWSLMLKGEWMVEL